MRTQHQNLLYVSELTNAPFFCSLPTDLAELTNSCDWLHSAMYSPFVSDTSVCDTSQFLGDMAGNVFMQVSFHGASFTVIPAHLLFSVVICWSVLSSNYYERRWLCYASLPIQIMFPCFPVLPFPFPRFQSPFTNPEHGRFQSFSKGVYDIMKQNFSSLAVITVHTNPIYSHGITHRNKAVITCVNVPFHANKNLSPHLTTLCYIQ